MDRRVRILVVGNSTTYMVAPDPAASPPWPRLVEQRLRAAGVDAVVELEPDWFGLLPDGARRWEQEWRGRAHDVVVVVYGYADMQPNLIPTSAVRWATTWDRGVGTRRAKVRARATRAVWPPLRRLGRRTAATVASPTWRVHPERFRAALGRWAALAVRDGTAVVVADIQPVVGRYEYVFPGLSERRQRYQQVIAEVVEDAPPGVVLWRLSAIDPGTGEHLPDALHFDAEGHHAAALGVTACIEEALAQLSAARRPV